MLAQIIRFIPLGLVEARWLKVATLIRGPRRPLSPIMTRKK